MVLSSIFTYVCYVMQCLALEYIQVDPLFFTNGVRMVWRNGDTTDTAGHKCTAINGTKNLNPTVSIINSYAWIYTW